MTSIRTVNIAYPREYVTGLSCGSSRRTLKLSRTRLGFSTSLAIVIDSKQGQVVGSDSFFKHGNVEKNHYLGVGESYAEAMKTYQRVREEADIIIPLYDPEVFERCPGGRIA
jgi:hypothetical protein